MVGIYKITNIINNKMYIGQSINMESRFKSHINSLKKNNHHNRHLQFAFNKYGENNFKFEIIIECNINELDDNEIKLIHELNSVIDGYNLDYGGQNHRVFSKKTRKRMSDARKKIMTPELLHWLRTNSIGRKTPDSVKKKIGDSIRGEKHHFYGKHHTEEIKKRMSDTLKGRYAGKKNPFYGKHHTEETKQKLRDYNIGKKPTEETKKKISETLKQNPPFLNRHHTEDSKQKISEKLTGRINGPRTIETKKKISETLKGRVVTKEHREKISRTLKLKKIYKILDVLDTIITHKIK